MKRKTSKAQVLTKSKWDRLPHLRPNPLQPARSFLKQVPWVVFETFQTMSDSMVKNDTAESHGLVKFLATLALSPPQQAKMLDRAGSWFQQLNWKGFNSTKGTSCKCCNSLQRACHVCVCVRVHSIMVTDNLPWVQDKVLKPSGPNKSQHRERFCDCQLKDPQSAAAKPQTSLGLHVDSKVRQRAPYLHVGRMENHITVGQIYGAIHLHYEVQSGWKENSLKMFI